MKSKLLLSLSLLTGVFSVNAISVFSTEGVPGLAPSYVAKLKAEEAFVASQAAAKEALELAAIEQKEAAATRKAAASASKVEAGAKILDNTSKVTSETALPKSVIKTTIFQNAQAKVLAAATSVKANLTIANAKVVGSNGLLLGKAFSPAIALFSGLGVYAAYGKYSANKAEAAKQPEVANNSWYTKAYTSAKDGIVSAYNRVETASVNAYGVAKEYAVEKPYHLATGAVAAAVLAYGAYSLCYGEVATN